MPSHARWKIAACLLTGWIGPACGQVPPLAAAMDRTVAVAQGAGLAGEIAIGDADGSVLDRAFGLADRGRRRPHRVGDRWLWASVSKQMAAVLVMQQVDAQALSLDGTVTTYLPDFAGPTGQRLTVRQLLQHRSGLPNPNDTASAADAMPPFYLETGVRIGDAARATGFCSGVPKAEPGSPFDYNNCDYLVLGAILERVTGRSFATLVAERIAGPLGLRSVRVARDGDVRGGAVAVGYDGPDRRAASLNVATYGAAGALTGTASDLLAIDRALVAGVLLPPAARAVAWQGDPALGYEALGVWSFPARLRGCASPVALVERRGDVGGIQVRNVIAPTLGRSIVVFTNDEALDFGEIWQGKGLAYDLLSTALCAPVDR